MQWSALLLVLPSLYWNNVNGEHLTRDNMFCLKKWSKPDFSQILMQMPFMLLWHLHLHNKVFCSFLWMIGIGVVPLLWTTAILDIIQSTSPSRLKEVWMLKWFTIRHWGCWCLYHFLIAMSLKGPFFIRRVAFVRRNAIEKKKLSSSVIAYSIFTSSTD